MPSLSRSDNDSPLSYVYWAIVPHLLWTLVSAVWVGLLGAANLVCWYFGHAEVRMTWLIARRSVDLIVRLFLVRCGDVV